MTNIEKKIWMNVTASANWHRPAVGTVRVEQFLSAELQKLYGERFKFCIWQQDKFVELKSLLSMSRVENISGVMSISSPQTQIHSINESTRSVRNIATLDLPLIYPISNRRHALKMLAESALSLAPVPVRPYINKMLYMMRPIILSILNSSVKKYFLTKSKKNRFSKKNNIKIFEVQSSQFSEDLNGESIVDLENQITANHSSIFENGDVLISIGADWDYNYYEKFWALRHEGVRVVTCCHDTIPILFPQYCLQGVAEKFASYFLYLAEGSDLILCDSKCSEKDLNNFLEKTGGARPLTHVFPLGDTLPATKKEAISIDIENLLQQPFILFVSTIERRKNHEVLYRAYHLLCSQGTAAILPKMVFVGMKGWGVDDLMNDIKLDPLVRDLFIILNNVSDSELWALYDAAEFCVYPSLYEGWGLPVGEALSLGKALLCSDRASIPEVGGDLVQYIDSWCPKDWADAILKMVTDLEWRKSWEEKVRNSYKIRTWADAAISVKNKIDQLFF